MTFALTKQEEARRDELGVLVQRKLAEFEDAINEYNAKVGDLRLPVEEACDGLNEAIEQAREFCSGIADEAQTQYDEKSEKWQEGERGQSAQEWISEYENANFPEIEIDWPEELAVEVDITDLDTMTVEAQ